MRQGLAAIARAAAGAIPVPGTVPAMAGAGDGPGGRLLARRDRGGDGAAAEGRIARRVAKMFARMDRNGDGRVERAELAARADARFAQGDADDDGRVTAAEIRARWQARRHGDEGEAHPVE